MSRAAIFLHFRQILLYKTASHRLADDYVAASRDSCGNAVQSKPATVFRDLADWMQRQETLLIDVYTNADLDLTELLVDGSNIRSYCCQGTRIYDNASTFVARQILVQCRPGRSNGLTLY